MRALAAVLWLAAAGAASAQLPGDDLLGGPNGDPVGHAAPVGVTPAVAPAPSPPIAPQRSPPATPPQLHVEVSAIVPSAPPAPMSQVQRRAVSILGVPKQWTLDPVAPIDAPPSIAFDPYAIGAPVLPRTAPPTPPKPH